MQPDGDWAEISFCPIIKDNEIVGIACHSHDISERMQSEKRLENQNRELLKTNFELDRFVYSVSHDLRSPLTSVLGLLSFMEEETTEAETLQHVHMIRSRIHRLDDFIKNILNYSRNNRTELEIQMVTVEKIILETVSSLADIKQAKNIEFKINCAEQVQFCSDLLSFKTIVENIISNAIKFAAKSRTKPYIRIKAKTDAKKLSLVIEDNGIGIPQKHQEKIFDMFFRASADTEGSGIGLYIVREIVEKLGGTITVKSEENKKTTFTITLKNFKPWQHTQQFMKK